MYIYVYVIMKTMCPPGYHHNGFVATHALGPYIYIYTVYVYIYIYIYICMYVYICICNHENNVPSRLSPQ